MMKHTTLRFTKTKLALACLSIFSLGAHAETVAPDGSLETVTVVGHKVTELNEETNGGALGNLSVLETPFSVDMITLEDLEIRQVNTLDSLFSREASVSVDGSSYSNFGSTIRVRGLPLDYTNSFKVNGLSANNFSGELPYEAFEQVALLKGATGYMYGMAAPGGVVNYVTKKPVEDFIMGNVGYRSDSVFSAHLDASERFGADKQFGVRVNLVHEAGDTYLEDGTIDRQTISVAADAHLTDALIWTLDFIYTDRLTENSWTVMSNSMSSDDVLPDPVSGTRSIAPNGTFDEYQNLIVLTGLNWEINDKWTAKVEYDFSQNDTSWVKTLAYLQNSDGDVSINTYEQYFRVDHEQVQGVINGEFSTGNLEHKLVAGVVHQVSDVYRNDGGDYGRIVTWGYGMDNLYDPVELDTYEPSLKKDLELAWSDTQKSIFANDSISFTDEWELMLGARYTHIDHSVGDYFLSYQDNVDDSALSPVAALMYKPNDHTTYYLSYVESFEAQYSTVGDSYANANEILDPLESDQLEIGFKQSGDGWSATAALFRIERGAEIVNDDNYLVQSGVSVYQGLEFSGALDVSENFSLYGDVMWLDATYDNTDDDTEGNQVAGTPSFQMTLQTNYTVPAVEGLSLNLGGKHIGDTASDSNNVWTLPSYTIIYAGASYQTEIAGNKLTLIGSVDNLFDKEYWAVGDDYGAIRFGEPRMVALKAKMDF